MMSSAVKEDNATDGQVPHPSAMYSFFPSTDDRMRRPSTSMPPQFAHLFGQQGLLSNTQSGSFSGALPNPQLGYNDLGPRPSADFAIAPQAQRMSEYVLPVEFARDNRWADVRRYTEVIRKIAAEYGQSELTKDKYYELYNMGVSLLRTIDMLDPEKARRNDMTRESFSYPLVPGTQIPPSHAAGAPPNFDLDVMGGHKPSFAAEFYAARQSFSDPIYAAQAAAAAAQFAAAGSNSNLAGHPQGPSATTYTLYSQQQQQQQQQQHQQQQQQHHAQASNIHPHHPSSGHPHHPQASAQQQQQQHPHQQHHPQAHHPQPHPGHPMHPLAPHPPHSANPGMHNVPSASVVNRMKNFTGEVFFDDVSESRKPKRRRRRTVFATKRNLRCHMCNATETPEWRRGPDGDHTLCNACGLHYAKTLKKERKAREGRKHSIDILLNESGAGGQAAAAAAAGSQQNNKEGAHSAQQANNSSSSGAVGAAAAGQASQQQASEALQSGGSSFNALASAATGASLRSSSSSSNSSNGSHHSAALASQSGVNLVVSPLLPPQQSLSAASSPSVPRASFPSADLAASGNTPSHLPNGMKREMPSSDGDDSASDLDDSAEMVTGASGSTAGGGIGGAGDGGDTDSTPRK